MNEAHDQDTGDTVLDYEQLYSEYQRGLVDRLRGFGTSTEDLALWVPSEDPLTGLRNMLDALASAGRAHVTVRLGGRIMEGLSVDSVQTMANAFGTASLGTHGDAWLLKVTDLREAPSDVSRPQLPAAPAPRHTSGRESDPQSAVDSELYEHALRQAAAEARHEGAVEIGAAELSVTAEADRVQLALAVNPAEHRIVRAGFTGASDAATRGALERLCQLLVDVPMQEANDHAVGRLELSLRPGRQQRPVAGIVHPARAHPALTLAETLVRQAMSAYREATGYTSIENEYNPGPTKAWREADEATRRTWLEQALGEAATELDFAPAEVSVRDIQHDVRVVLELGESFDGPRKPAQLMALEAAIKRRVDPRLEVFLEERKDKNKLRRLAVVGG